VRTRGWLESGASILLPFCRNFRSPVCDPLILLTLQKKKKKKEEREEGIKAIAIAAAATGTRLTLEAIIYISRLLIARLRQKITNRNSK